ncbi:MAG TPA: hypothetical protein PK299_08150 [Anaerolineales bacterium]|nr:hypothetical protein [Anaerolineales bacterium]
MTIFDFDETDLLANQNGVWSEKQRNKLKKMTQKYPRHVVIGLCILIASIGSAIWFGEQNKILIVLAAFLVVCVLFALLRSARNFELLRLNLSPTACSGKIELVTSIQYHLRYRHNIFEVKFEDKPIYSLQLPWEQFKFLRHGHRYTFYYAENSGKIGSIIYLGE